ncbi:hypothetical protein O6H91_10G085300 [Diphasiastrum complanatum]|uniref:Uncharacterized protein n=1 Tax=Diphasiastrum complanatum TaxID=34168 RepID=A0ACC2CJ46_DIPCM|nr:hypothetical protein O6H91_10G085300 [Diphasiastrum complanatum]
MGYNAPLPFPPPPSSCTPRSPLPLVPAPSLFSLPPPGPLAKFARPLARVAREKRGRGEEIFFLKKRVSGAALMLSSRDSNGFSDPYVHSCNGRTKTKTKVVQKSLNPSWYEEFLVKLEGLKSELLISVWDEDSFSDDFLGQI